jgi:hypothetical protein
MAVRSRSDGAAPKQAPGGTSAGSPRTGPSYLRSPRDLPRNVRRAALAERLAERRSSSLGVQSVERVCTPTPPPVIVDRLPTAPEGMPERSFAPALREPEPRISRALLLGLLALAVLALGAIGRATDGMPLMANASTRAALGVVDGLLRGHRLPSAVGAAWAANEAEPIEKGPASSPLRRDGHVSVPGGIVVFPSSFTPDEDGSYDLYVHFHGNTSVVRESAEVAKLDAAVVIINLGIGSAPYEEFYAVPGTYEELLDSVKSALERRGVEHPQLRRVALGGWSAGYGAISTILQVQKKRDLLDAVLVYDGIHCGWEGGELNRRQLRPFTLAAERAVAGELYFGITHSEIDPRTYASTSSTAEHLVAAVGARFEDRDPERDAPTYLSLESMKGAVAKKLEKHMEPYREVRRGELHVVGYRGETKEHHMAHLFQMGATLLPELVDRWSKR